MDAKTFLGRAYRLDLKINTKLEQLEQLRALSRKVTSTIREEKVSGGETKNVMESAIIKIIVGEQSINAAVDKLISVKNEISELIDKVANDDERILLELRYLCFNAWDQISAKMSISNSYAFQLHRKAIEDCDTILENERRVING